MKKQTTISLRVDGKLRDLLKEIAATQRRSISNLIITMVEDQINSSPELRVKK